MTPVEQDQAQTGYTGGEGEGLSHLGTPRFIKTQIYSFSFKMPTLLIRSGVFPGGGADVSFHMFGVNGPR